MDRFVKRRSGVIVRLMGIACMASLAGCAPFTTVQPWEKGNLARPEMSFDRDTLDAKFNEHIYFSKEAANGGSGVGGGGCGCN